MDPLEGDAVMLFVLGCFLLFTGSAVLWNTKDESLFISVGAALCFIIGLLMVIGDVKETVRKTALIACESAPQKGVATCEAKAIVSLKDGEPTDLTFTPLTKAGAR